MAHAVRGFPLLLVYSGGFSAVCLICCFTASVRRFTVWGYPYTAAVPLVLYPLFVALWRGVVSCSAACRLRCQLAAVLVHLLPCGGQPAPVVSARGLRWPHRRAWLSAKVAGKVSGKVAKVAGIVVPLCAKVAVKVASQCAKVAHFPQNHSRLQNSVYKGGIFLARFPKVNGKPCKSRSISAHFTSKSLASMYFRWSCSGVKPSI